MSLKEKSPRISIIIVNYKVPEEICQLLSSLQEADCYSESEVIIIDNASLDHSQDMVTNKYPEVSWIALKNNLGFGKACNIAAHQAKEDYLLFINPDTLVSKNTLQLCVDFMESHLDVGIVGPKILKPDGTFQPHCRRSFPTPLNAFARFSGLRKVFPKSSRLGGYNLSHVSPDISMEVDAVSGSFMFMRHSLFNIVGGFDEIFFMYGEDLDLCARCKDAGYKIWYHPATQIIHFKGKSCNKNLVRSRIAFWEAMILFSKKYRHTYGAFFPGWVLTLGIIFFSAMNIGAIGLRSLKASFVDLFFINTILFATTSLRFIILHSSNPYSGENLLFPFALHCFLSISFVLTFALRGIYSSERYSLRNTLVSGLIASVFFYSVVFFIRSVAFSRIAFAIAAILITVSLAAWRTLFPRIISFFRRGIFTTGKVIIVGDTPIASALIKSLEKDISARIAGVIFPYTDNHDFPAEFEGYRVLGALNTITPILEKEKPDLLLIAMNDSWYSYIIESLSFLQLRHMSIQWVPRELFAIPVSQLPDPIPLKNFSV